MILIFTKENVCFLLPGVFIYLPNTASSMLRDGGCPELPRQSKTGLQVGEGACLFPSHHLPEGKALWDSNLKAELPIWSETRLCLLSPLLHKTTKLPLRFLVITSRASNASQAKAAVRPGPSSLGSCLFLDFDP